MKRRTCFLLAVLVLATMTMPMIGCGKGKSKGDPYVLGRIALDNREYEKAVGYFEKAAKEKPGDTKIIFALAEAHLGNKAPTKAIKQFEKVLDLDENMVEAHLRIADAEMLLARLARKEVSRGGDPREVLNHYFKAQTQCTLALDKKRDLAEAHLKLSQIFRARGDKPEQALAEVDQALALDPTLVRASLLKATLLYSSGSDDTRSQAVDVLTTALEKAEARVKAQTAKAKNDEQQLKNIKANADQDRSSLNWAIASIQIESGQAARAMDTLTKALEYSASASQTNTIRAELGKLHLESGNWKAAEEQAAEIQKTDRRWVIANYLIGRAALGRALGEKDREKRTELYRTAVNKLAGFSTYKDPEMLFWLGQAYRFRGGRDEPALTEFLKALSYVDENRKLFLASQIRLAMADVLIRKARYDEAESHCKQVLKLRPSNAEAMMTLAHVYILTGRGPLAADYIKRAIEIEPTSAMARLQLARVELYTGRPEQALTIVQEAIELAGEDSPEAYHLKGTIHRSLGQYERAAASFESALAADPAFSAAYMDLARTYLANDQREEAVELLKNYMKEQPAQAAAPAFLAGIHEQLSDTDRAIDYYREALKRDPKHIAAYRIARLHLLKGNFDSAIQKWRELLAIAKEKQIQIPGARLNLALALMLKKDYDQALLETQELEIEKLASQAAVSLCRIFLALADGDYDKARLTLRDARETPNNKMPVEDLINSFEADPATVQKVLTKLAYSIIDRNEHRIESAEKHLKEAIDLMPDSLILRAHLAHVYAQTGRRDELAEQCKKMTELNPRYAPPHVYLARMAEANKDAVEAISEYEKAVDLDNEAIEPRVRLAQLRFREQEYNTALALATEVLALDEGNFHALALKVGTLRTQGRQDEAERTLEEIVAKHRDRVFPKRLLAQVKLDKGQYDKAIELCDSALSLAKDDTTLRQIKADALIRRGQENDIGRAVTTLRDALAINDLNIDIIIALSRIYRATPRTTGYAENLLLKGLEKQPGSFRLNRELAEVYMTENKLDEAEKLIGEVLETADPARAALLRAQYDFIRALALPDAEEKKKRLGEIVLEVQKVTSADNKEEVYQAHLLLGKIYLQGYEDTTSATQAFEAAKQTSGDRREPDAWLAPIYFKQGLFTNSASSLEALKNTAFSEARLAIAKQADRNLTASERIARQALELPPQGNDSCKRALANILLDAGRTKEAIQTIETTTRMERELVAGYEQLALRLTGPERQTVATELNKAMFFLLSRRPKDVPDHYAAALELAHGDNIFLVMMLGRSLVEARRLDEAADNFEAAIKLNPDYLAARTDLARVYEMQKKPNKALAVYEGTLEKEPKNARLALKIASLYHATGRLPQAQKYYSRVIELDPKNTAAQFNLGLTYESQKLIKKALTAYDKTIELAPDNPATFWAYNNAAWHYAVKENPNLKKALAYALKAKDLAPEQPEVRDTLGWVLYLSGKLDVAKHEAQTAAMALPTSGSVQYHYAVVLSELGEKEHAIRVLESAIDLNFSVEYDKKKAGELLHKLKNPD